MTEDLFVTGALACDSVTSLIRNVDMEYDEANLSIGLHLRQQVVASSNFAAARGGSGT
jgi:hypothetical protein